MTKNPRRSSFKKLRDVIVGNKVSSLIILAVCIAGGFGIYSSAKTANAEPQYAVSPVHFGSIIQTVTGTGQVSAENQLDVASKASGAITSIKVTVGQHVKAGDLLATIDDTDALNSFKSAQIAYAKAVLPPTNTALANANDSVDQAYSTAFNAISSTFTSLQTVIPGLNTTFYGKDRYLSDQQATNLTTTGQNYRNDAGTNYDSANVEYQKVLIEYKALSRSSATSTIVSTLADTYSMAKDIAAAVQKTANAITFITTSQPNYQTGQASTAQSNVSAWLSTMNNAVSSLLSAQTGITSADNSLSDLITGPTNLDIQSQQLSLTQAEQTYQNYFVRAPFDGIVGRIPVSVYGQAGSGTAIATIIGDKKIATISLNEIDAAKVAVGETATITFDAVSNLTATGTVSQVDLVGTVTQGVVSYGVKISINTTDDRIKPGMSLNTTITTSRKDGVLIVPSSAVKTQGARSYVQVLDASTLANQSSAQQTTASSTALRARFNRGNATSTGSTGGVPYFASATSTNGFSSSTFAGRFASTSQSAATSRTLTISTSVLPKQVFVITGESDDTNTEITSGLTQGELVVTRTISAGSASTQTTTAAPSILNSLGGNRGGATGGANRAFVGGGRVGG